MKTLGKILKTLFWGGVVIVCMFIFGAVLLVAPGKSYEASNDTTKVEEKMAEPGIGDFIETMVAKDTQRQYNMAVRNGDAMQAYIQAGICAAAYMQANDERNYRKWKDIENSWAKKIGLPTYSF